MYKIIRNNKRLANTTFDSYDAARKYVRQWAVKKGLAINQTSFNLGDLGINITRV